MNVPPWVADPEPQCWVTLPQAARVYFRKSVERVHQMRRDGTLTEVGIKVWFSGTRWYCRLSVPLPQESTKNPTNH